MTRAVLGLRSVFAAGMVLALGTVAGCGTDGSSSSGGAGMIDRSGGNGVAGVPETTAVAGQPYSFQPKIAPTSGSARFTVTNLPAWAQFNTTTGQISGTPSAQQVGQYSGITISVIADGQTTALPPFTITVAASGSSADSVTLSWQAPTENSDGSALMDLKGYKVHYGPASRSYSETIQLANAGLTTYVLQNLPAGKYYFAVTSYNSNGRESALSGEVSTRVD